MSQAGLSSEIKQLAAQLIALEAGSQPASGVDGAATCHVCENLRLSLVSLTGTAGFGSLLTRALTLAQREAPALSSVQVKPDGSLDGFVGDAILAQPILVSHLVSLLFTFIGQTLTMRLLHDVWPDLPVLRETSLGKESI